MIPLFTESICIFSIIRFFPAERYFFSFWKKAVPYSAEIAIYNPIPCRYNEINKTVNKDGSKKTIKRKGGLENVWSADSYDLLLEILLQKREDFPFCFLGGFSMHLRRSECDTRRIETAVLFSFITEYRQRSASSGQTASLRLQDIQKDVIFRPQCSGFSNKEYRASRIPQFRFTVLVFRVILHHSLPFMVLPVLQLQWLRNGQIPDFQRAYSIN